MTNKSWFFVAGRILRTKRRPSWRWCRTSHQLFVSDLLYSNLSHLWVLYFHHIIIFADVTFLPSCFVSKSNASILFLSWHCGKLLWECCWYPSKEKSPPTWWRSISLLTWWRHSLSISMSSALKPFVKLSFPIPSMLLFLVRDIDNILKIVLHNVTIREDRNPITSIALWCFDTIHTEATW